MQIDVQVRHYIKKKATITIKKKNHLYGEDESPRLAFALPFMQIRAEKSDVLLHELRARC